MKPNLNLRPPAPQRGVATLMIALVLLLAATFITVYSARVGLNEQRMAANDSRAKESFQNAEGGLEYAKSWLLANRDSFSGWSWTDCADGDTDLPCGYAGVNQYTSVWSYVSMPSSLITELNWTVSSGPYVYTQSPGAEWQPLVMAARGNSLDTTGEAVVKQGMSKRTVLNTGPVPPVMAPTVDLTGSLTVLANPAAGAAGEPLPFSVWTENPFCAGGNMVTCGQGGFVDNSGVQCIGPTINDPITGSPPNWVQCACNDGSGGSEADDERYSYKDGADCELSTDVVENDPDYPADMFAYIFALSPEDVRSVSTVLPDCSTLNGLSSGFFWITGFCDVATGTTVGSRAAPVVIILEANAKFAGGAGNPGTNIWGIVYGYGPTTEVKTVGNVSVHGSLIIEGDMSGSQNGGTFNIMYDPEVFSNLALSDANNIFGVVSGSWFDGL